LGVRVRVRVRVRARVRVEVRVRVGVRVRVRVRVRVAERVRAATLMPVVGRVEERRGEGEVVGREREARLERQHLVEHAGRAEEDLARREDRLLERHPARLVRQRAHRPDTHTLLTADLVRVRVRVKQGPR
jgi:hypothetical protein